MLYSIPYDSSIALGNIVDPVKLERLKRISEKQAPVDNAEDEVNSLIALKRSLDTTINELENMNVDPTEVIAESNNVAEEIKAAAVNYARLKVNAKKDIQQIMAESQVSSNWESPIDYDRTEIKKMPLSADSMNMNVQYFSNEGNSQKSDTQSKRIQAFISGEFQYLGNKISEQASKAAASQLNSQYSRHSITGTLVIAVSCTHKDAALLAPCVIDVDKAINVWNSMYRDDMLKTDSVYSMVDTAAKAQTDEERAITIVSGATYGSCFVGMVHVLNTTSTTAAEKMQTMAKTIQKQCNVKSWLRSVSGGLGINDDFASDIKSLLSMQEISSNCTITTRGSIPSIKSNEVKMAVKEFAKFDGETAMSNLAALQNATASDMDSINASAQKARKAQDMVALQNSQIKGVLTGLNEIDSGNNKIIDINALMTAFEDYVNKALAGELGMPINYYLKPITKSQLAKMWVDKYFPNNFIEQNTGSSEAPESA